MQVSGGLRSASSVPIEPCWLEVDLEAIAANVAAIRKLVGSRTAIAAVVKADAYGLGAVAVARAALQAGATWLAVARVSEGIELRRAGLTAPILNLAFAGPDELPALIEFGLIPTLADLPGARALAAAVPAGQMAPFHLKVDTGLSRFGAQPDELEELLSGLHQLPNLRLEGLYSHFSVADEADQRFSQLQIQRFQRAAARVLAHGFAPPLYHLANSAATLALPEARLDLVRLGITLSGHYPSDEVPTSPELRPAVALRSRLARVYDLPRGASVGYGRTYLAPEAHRVGLVPAGYADGLPRAHSNRGAVLVRGQRAPILGRVSMDQCVVDLSAIPSAQPGDEVTLFGRQGSSEIALSQFADWSGTIPHEALCRIGPRVPRYYRHVEAITAPAGNGLAQAGFGSRHDAAHSGSHRS